jgi:hypothetical protein
MHPLTSVIALGLDSFLACTVIGTWPLSWRERGCLSLAFGMCDALAAALGSLRPHGWVGDPAITLGAVCLFLIVTVNPSKRSLLYALPMLLSLDNLFAGSPVVAAPILGLSSASMAFLGLCVATLRWRAFVFAEEM